MAQQVAHLQNEMREREKQAEQLKQEALREHERLNQELQGQIDRAREAQQTTRKLQDHMVDLKER
jgi:hypothetical protein